MIIFFLNCQFWLVFQVEMSFLKLFLLILYFSEVFASRPQKQNFEPYSRYKSVNCSSSLITLSSFNCFVKATSRTNTTLNIIANISRPVYSVDIQFDFRSKSLSNSQRSIINTTFEACSVLNGTMSNPVVNWVLGFMPALKKILHPCPYQVLNLAETQ